MEQSSKDRRKASNRPIFLLRWVESLDVGPVVDTDNINFHFKDGLYLIKILQRLCPEQKFIGVRWRPRSEASCIANLELSLSFIWRKSVRASKMSSATDLYRATTSEKWLYVLNTIFEAFVLRELKSSFKETLSWYQSMLSPFCITLGYFAGQGTTVSQCVGATARNAPPPSSSANSSVQYSGMRGINSSINLNSSLNASVELGGMGMQAKVAGAKEQRMKTYLKQSFCEDFADCVSLFCVSESYCRARDRVNGVAVFDGPKSTSIYRHPTNMEERRANATVVFEFLNHLGVPLFWTSDEWVEYQDIGFMIFQLGLIKATLSAPLHSVPMMTETEQELIRDWRWRDSDDANGETVSQKSQYMSRDRSGVDIVIDDLSMTQRTGTYSRPPDVAERSPQALTSLVDSAIVEIEEVSHSSEHAATNNSSGRVTSNRQTLDINVFNKQRSRDPTGYQGTVSTITDTITHHQEQVSPDSTGDKGASWMNQGDDTSPTRQRHTAEQQGDYSPSRSDGSNNVSDTSDAADDDAIESMLNLSHPDGYTVRLLAPVEMLVNLRLMGVVNTLSGPRLGDNASLRLTDTVTTMEYFVGLLEIKNVSVTKNSIILSSGSEDFAVGSRCIIVDFEGESAAEDSQAFAWDLSKVLAEAYTVFMGKTR